MPSDKLTELGIKKSKSGIKEKKLYDGQGLYLLLHHQEYISVDKR